MRTRAKEKIDFIQNHFKVISKDERLVPMILWTNQRHYIENRTNRDVVLKGRQMGQSTGIEADDSEELFNMPYQRQTIITHDAETSEFLFQNVQRFYRNLPWNMNKPDTAMMPSHDWKSGTRMRFPVIDSYIYIDSAKSDSIGVGHTLNKAHLSEIAKWPDRKARQLFADITQTVPMTGFVTLESTPQGRGGLLYEVYDEAKRGINGFTAFFYPWWWDINYVASVEEYMTPQKADITAIILGQSTAAFLKDEKLFAETYTLSPAQLAFRRMKIGEIKLLFFQEYPENDIDCWLSGEMAIIEASSLRPYYPLIKEGRQEGALTIWKDAIGGRNYVIGVDVASGSARDYSVASVLDTRTMEYVARVRGKIHTDLFAEQVFELGKRYNLALIAVEKIGHGHSVLRVLLNKQYPNLYYHTDYDELMKVNVTDAGWRTSIRTKPLMINGMITAFRSQDLIAYSENLLLEVSSLMWENGVDSKVRTTSGGNDDEFDAVAIALQVRESAPLSEFEEKRTPVKSYVKVSYL